MRQPATPLNSTSNSAVAADAPVLATRSEEFSTGTATAQGPESAPSVKEWLRQHSSADEHPRNINLCVTAALMLASISASTYVIKTQIWSGVCGHLPMIGVVSVQPTAIPHTVSDWHAQGRRAALEGRLSEAAELLKKAERCCASKHPLRAELLNELGAALIALDKKREALPYLQEALALDPELASAQHNLSLCRLYQ